MSSIWQVVKLCIQYVPLVISAIRELIALFKSGDKKVVSAMKAANDGDHAPLKKCVADSFCKK